MTSQSALPGLIYAAQEPLQAVTPPTYARAAEHDSIPRTPAYNAVEEATAPLIDHYHDDLFKHDRQFCADHPTWKFLHFAGPCGTHLVSMPPAEDYPRRGEYVPYLFGTADRDHVLNGGHSVIVTIEKSSDRRTVHYWDGKRLQRVAFKEARYLYLDYMEAIRAAWNAPRS